AILAALDHSAQESQQLLRNYYLKGLHSYQRGLEHPPFGFLIPAGQGDPARVAAMVDRLMAQGVEVHRADAAVTLKEGSFPAGTYVVRLDQPYRDYAVELPTPQNLPKDAGNAYDDISWELPAHYHLTAVATADPAVRNAGLTLVTTPPQPAGVVSGAGPVFLLKDSGQEELLEARYRLAHFKLSVAEHAFSVGGLDYPQGSWILAPQAGLAAAVRDTAAKLALDFVSAAAVPEVASHEAP